MGTMLRGYSSASSGMSCGLIRNIDRSSRGCATVHAAMESCWDVSIRLRCSPRSLQDKSEPNDLRTAKRVVESIQDDLKEEDIKPAVPTDMHGLHSL